MEKARDRRSGTGQGPQGPPGEEPVFTAGESSATMAGHIGCGVRSHAGNDPPLGANRFREMNATNRTTPPVARDPEPLLVRHGPPRRPRGHPMRENSTSARSPAPAPHRRKPRIPRPGPGLPSLGFRPTFGSACSRPDPCSFAPVPDRVPARCIRSKPPAQRPKGSMRTGRTVLRKRSSGMIRQGTFLPRD